MSHLFVEPIDGCGLPGIPNKFEDGDKDGQGKSNEQHHKDSSDVSDT